MQQLLRSQVYLETAELEGAAENLLRSLAEADDFDIRIRKGVKSSELTTFGLGSPVPWLIEPGSIAALEHVREQCFRRGVLPRFLGAGSNSVLPDSPLNSPVLRLGKAFSAVYLLESPCEDAATFRRILADSKPVSWLETERSGNDAIRLLAPAGASLMGLSRRSAQAGFSGLEFAAGIPASVGGAVKMNAGAHGHSLIEVLRRVFLIDETGQLCVKTPQELSFGYRHSGITDTELIVGAEIELRKGDKAAIRNERLRCLEYRKLTQPLSAPSSGSVFRNPALAEDHPYYRELGPNPAAALLLEKAGMKGKELGTVGFSKLHANWLVRLAEEGRAADATRLIAEAQEVVRQRFKVELNPEIVIW